MKIDPIGKNVLVSQEDSFDHSEGGILLPGSMAERDYQGKVLAVGSQVTACTAGDYVVFRAGKSQPAAGKLLVSQDDLLALIRLE